MDGVIQGGWEYVIASYALVWGGIFLYGASVVLRAKRARSHLPPSDKK